MGAATIGKNYWIASERDNVLEGSGKISHLKALEKAREEYRKYQVQNLSPVEEAYLNTIKNVEQTAKKKIES